MKKYILTVNTKLLTTGDTVQRECSFTSLYFSRNGIGRYLLYFWLILNQNYDTYKYYKNYEKRFYAVVVFLKWEWFSFLWRHLENENTHDFNNKTISNS